MISLQSGQQIQNGTIITIQGTYSSAGSGQVWVVLEDDFGNYYLQIPPVRFLGGGQWIAKNVRPGKGITMVDFVFIPAGNKVFQQMEEQIVAMGGKTPPFRMLPDGSTTLQTISIQVI